MKKSGFLTCLVAFFLLSCGNGQKKFKIEGSFKGFNQGELYVYGLNGAHKLDTIAVNGGEFTYQAAIAEPTTLVVVFPNFSEIPVFAEPGIALSMEGDASHLKETEVKGSDTNKEMTAFRLKTNNMLPPEVIGEATSFINEKPSSPISVYLLNKYFIQTPDPDYTRIQRLVKTIQTAQPNNEAISVLSRKLDGLKNARRGSRLPTFSTIGLNGERVTSADLNAKVNVITLWASWNYESISIQNQLARLQKMHPGDLKVLSISVDGSVKDCKQIVDRDSINWSTVCDGRMWETPVLQQIGLTYLPDNIVMDSQGRILGRSLNYQDLNIKIEELIK